MSEPRTPLRILWCIDSLDQEDGEMVWFHYLRYLAAESKHQFQVVALKDGSMKAIYEKVCPVTIAPPETELTGLITRLHLEQSFDVAFVSSVENVWFPKVLKTLSIPTLWQLYPGSADTTQIAEGFQYPATILFLNRAIADQYKQSDLRDVSRILPTGVDLADIKLFRQRNSPVDLRVKFGITKTSTVITIAGPTIPRKGQKEFISAALEVLNSRPDMELDFYVVGERPGTYLIDLRQLIEQSGKAQRFHLIPEAQDAFQYYPFLWMSDICVSCSTEETFPLTVLEAMAFKKAVIANNVFSTNEVVEHEENGFLITGHQELVQAMLEMIDHADLRDAFARRSLEIVYEKYQFKKIATRLEDLLRETVVY